MVVFADKSREAELIDIWHQSFGDSEEYIRMFFEWNISKTMIIVYEVDGRAVSVAYLLPVTYVVSGQEEVPCWYLYAAATLPEYRGCGYFGEIMKVIQNNVPEPVILVPGEESLIGFYKKNGLHVWLQGQTMEITYDAEEVSAQTILEDFSIKDITVTEYTIQRDESLSKSGYIKWDEHFMNYICHENKICGGSQKEVSVDGSKYIVMYRVEGQELRILELLPQTSLWERSDSSERAGFSNRTGLEACVQLLLRETGCMKANVCLKPTVMATDNYKAPDEEGYFNLTMG